MFRNNEPPEESGPTAPLAAKPKVPAPSGAAGDNLTMVSPNTGSLDFPGAIKAIDTPAYAEAVETVAAAAPKGSEVNGKAAGVWNGGAENTIVTQHPADITPEEQEAFAAKAGSALNQISVLNFRSGPGPHVLYEVTFPKADLATAHRAMLDAGLTDSTLAATKDGVTAHVLDTQDPTRPVQPGIEKLASLKEAPGITAHTGTGNFVGASDWNAPDAREQAQGVYRSILEKAGNKGEQPAGGEPDDRGAAPAAPAGGEPAQPLASQPGAAAAGAEAPVGEPAGGEPGPGSAGVSAGAQPLASLPAGV